MLAFVLAVAYNFVSSYTSTEADGLSKLEIFVAFHLLIWLSLLSWSEIVSNQGVVFEVPSQQANQKSIVFGKVMAQFDQDQNSESEGQTSPQLYHYEQNCNKR